MELERRHAVEKEWHERRAKPREKSRPDLYTLGALSLADAFAWEILGQVSGKVVVELGCGDGQNAVRLAARGATVYTLDLSHTMLKVAHRMACSEEAGGRVFIAQMAAERLAYPNGFADVVFGHSVLHHTDLPLARQEVHRILKRGGRAVFLEPLGHNPLLNLFRSLTPSRRTPTERPLHFEDVFFFAQPFSLFRHREFYLVALVASALAPLRNGALFQGVLNALSRVDEALLARWPGWGKHAWVVVWELVK